MYNKKRIRNTTYKTCMCVCWRWSNQTNKQCKRCSKHTTDLITVIDGSSVWAADCHEIRTVVCHHWKRPRLRPCLHRTCCSYQMQKDWQPLMRQPLRQLMMKAPNWAGTWSQRRRHQRGAWLELKVPHRRGDDQARSAESECYGVQSGCSGVRDDDRSGSHVGSPLRWRPRGLIDCQCSSQSDC